MQEAIRRFTIGEPLKSLFKPIFMLQMDGEITTVKLTALAPDSLGSGREVNIVLDQMVSPYDAKNIDAAFHFLRGMVHKMLAHEADEAILVDGERKFDPHKHEIPRPW